MATKIWDGKGEVPWDWSAKKDQSSKKAKVKHGKDYIIIDGRKIEIKKYRITTKIL